MDLLSVHQKDLLRASAADVSPREKLDVTANTLLAVLNESLEIGPVKKSVRHIDQFNKVNKQTLEGLFKDINQWTDGMSKNERTLFYIGLATKPYTLKLVQTIPKVERKISRKIAMYQFFGSLLNLVKI